MKQHSRLLIIALVALTAPYASQAATLTEAKITQIVRDVKTVDPAKGARPASMNETLQGRQSVRTGVDSRTELLFNDMTITRLGANTHFSFVEGTRNMALDHGVMMLQVPKDLGGAKIQTAAVTAAVTGTTIMIEAGKDYTKLIVLEGECCLWPQTGKRKESGFFKVRHKVCALAGQEIIQRNGAREISKPVYINLKTLFTTSKLLNGKWNADLELDRINAAIEDQTLKDYIPTNLAIIGAGTDAIVLQEQAPSGNANLPVIPPLAATETSQTNTIPGPTGQPTPTSQPAPGKFGAPTTINSGGPYIIGAGTTINTDPIITNGGKTDYGTIYRGPAIDGPAVDFLFGPNSGISEAAFESAFLGISEPFPTLGVAAFRFSNLIIEGQPVFDFGTSGAYDLALISDSDIRFIAASPKTLDFSPLHSLTLATAKGIIDLGANFTVTGLSGFLKLYNNGSANGINVASAIALPNADFFADTQGQLTVSGKVVVNNLIWNSATAINLTETGEVTANGSATLSSLQTINLNGNVHADYLTLNAVNNITVKSAVTAYGFTAQTGQGILVPDGSIGTVDAYVVTLRTGTDSTVSQGGKVSDFYFQSSNSGQALTLSSSNITSLTIASPNLHLTGDFDFLGNKNAAYLSLTANGGFESGLLDIGGNIYAPAFVATATTIAGTGSNAVHANVVSFTVNGLETVRLSQPVQALAANSGASLPPVPVIFQNGVNNPLNIDTASLDSFYVSASNLEVVNDLTQDLQNTNITLYARVTLGIDGKISANGINISAYQVIAESENTLIDGKHVSLSLYSEGTFSQDQTNLPSAKFSSLQQPNQDAYPGRTGTLPIDLTNTQSLTLYGSPLHITSDLNLGGIDLTIDGTADAAANPSATPSAHGNIIARNFAADNLVADGQVSVTKILPTGYYASNSIRASSIEASQGIAFNDGSSSLTLSANALLFDSGAGGINGADFNGYDGSLNQYPAGNGGTFDATATTGDLTVNTPITATTGNNASGIFTGGNGGTVNLTATNGTVSVNNAIEVSSKDPGPAPSRRSATGGRINLTSGKTSGTAIHIKSSGDLKALLDAAAPGPGGAITFKSSGGDILVQGKLTADRGTIDVRNNGASTGLVHLDGAQLAADVIKVASLGANGEVRIGGNANISAATAMQLYAPGSNGTVHFVGNATLAGAGTKAIAANTVTLDNGVLVNVAGPAATVYTSHPNYQGSGGNNSTSGMFTGTGASTLPFNSPGKPAF